MLEFPHKKIKRTIELPEDVIVELPEHLVEYIISTFFPILQLGVVSKAFRVAWIQSRDLDFSMIYSKRRSQSEVVSIIDDIFNQHKGSEINRFVLMLDHRGVKDKILSWVKTCQSKNIQELTLDFSKSKKVIDLSVDFSAIETLTVLNLRWCKFEIPNNTLKGLRLLRTLALMKAKVTPEMIDAIFSNCINLETLELTRSKTHGILSIKAQNHKKFKKLALYSMPNRLQIIMDAPTLECFKYEGFVRILDFSKVGALTEAELHYIQDYSWRYYNSSHRVLANMDAYTGVHVLSTTNIFLEIKKFKFEPGMLWQIHQKSDMECKNYKFDTIKEVTIDGFKNHWHELDIVEFFFGHAKWLKKLELIMPKKFKKRSLDYARLYSVRSRYPWVNLKV
ncbi:unnamed protein product [Eruca vesicaria subsp. sativa]|uniref:At1g61320/AtMIF1 LRR domain-containing protein n=1 Tax=Eruca vesicaria subsp. sativa TaxID=29727 RepID=A0ABC8L1X8_ERUVS|nr:unnamed protein product [Eruca vesicaria subsp. sativa]